MPYRKTQRRKLGLAHQAGIQAAYKVARTAYNAAYENRKEIADSLRTATRYARQWEKRYKPREKVGEEVGTDDFKRQATAYEDRVLQDTRTLYQANLTALAGNSTDVDIDGRNAALIHLNGISIDMEVTNQSAIDLYFNWAMISPKGLSTNPNTSDFFRGHGSTRAIDFSATTLSSLDFHSRPINTDMYHVLTHRRHVIPYEGSGYGSNTIQDRKFQKIKRQIRFDNMTGTTSRTPIYLVYWFCHVNEDADNSGNGVEVEQAHITYTAVCYFKDTK
jgi:hypothetical protein